MFDLATDYCFSLNKNRDKAKRCFLLLFEMEKYVNGAIVQMKRMNKTKKELNNRLKDISEGKINIKLKLNYLLIDTHFYFICIDKVYKLISKLGAELDDSDIKDLENRINKYFKITIVRSHFEHIDERCLGYINRKDAKEGNSRHISDFGNFVDDGYTFNGETFPTKEESLLEIKSIYTALIKILKEKYAQKDYHFLHRQQTKEIFKNLKKELRKNK